MAMVGVVSGSMYRRTDGLSRLAWCWVGSHLAPFYIHQMNRVNSRNGSAMMTDSTINIVLVIIIIIIIIIWLIALRKKMQCSALSQTKLERTHRAGQHWSKKQAPHWNTRMECVTSAVWFV